jgi:hypothetical protein
VVLYESADRVCKVKGQEVKLSNEEHTNLKQNFSIDVFCKEINKTLPAPSSEIARPLVSLLKAKFENSSYCKQACLQGNLINPICMYILAANTFTVTNNEGELQFFVIVTRLPDSAYVCLSACSVAYDAWPTLSFAQQI